MWSHLPDYDPVLIKWDLSLYHFGVRNLWEGNREEQTDKTGTYSGEVMSELPCQLDSLAS